MQEQLEQHVHRLSDRHAKKLIALQASFVAMVAEIIEQEQLPPSVDGYNLSPDGHHLVGHIVPAEKP